MPIHLQIRWQKSPMPTRCLLIHRAIPSTYPMTLLLSNITAISGSDKSSSSGGVCNFNSQWYPTNRQIEYAHYSLTSGTRTSSLTQCIEIERCGRGQWDHMFSTNGFESSRSFFQSRTVHTLSRPWQRRVWAWDSDAVIYLLPVGSHNRSLRVQPVV